MSTSSCFNQAYSRAIRAGLTAGFMLALGAVPLTSGYASAATVEVKMTDTPPVYVPAKLTVKSGDTVKWTNNAQTLHTVTADAAKAVDKSDVQLPKGVAPFDSGFMMPGNNFSYTFKTPGQYKYFCIPHEKDGMIGYVTVTK